MGLIKIGCCGFPISRKKYYKIFDIVEINSTFYQLPDISIATRWRNEAPTEFKFTLKAWQLITHLSTSPTYRRIKTELRSPESYGFFKNNRYILSAWGKMFEIAKILNAKVIVFQCPPNFTAEKGNIRNMETFFKKIQKDIKDLNLGIELRHSSWNEDIVKHLCEEFNLIHIVDPLRSKSVYGKIKYYRLHGDYNEHGRINYNYKYNDTELKKVISLSDAEVNYLFFNNIYMYEDAIRLKEMLK